MILVDSHCHLFMDPLGADAEAVCKRAIAAGVSRWLVAAYDVDSWSALEALVAISGVRPMLGLHPWAADQLFDSKELKDQIEKIGAVGIGEIGLDAQIESPSMTVQVDVFQQQLTLAADLDLPVALHCRGAFDTLLELLDAYPQVSGMVHGFSRGPELAAQFTARGFYISFGGAVTRSRATRARRSAKAVPLDRILVETDSPSLGLEGVEPGESEPKHVVGVATAMAEIRGLSLTEIAGATTSNVERLFGN
jgi:TatD DNase family protein